MGTRQCESRFGAYGRRDQRHTSTILYGLTLGELYENLDRLLRVLLKDPGKNTRHVQHLLRRIKRENAPGYLACYFPVLVVVRYINIDFRYCKRGRFNIGERDRHLPLDLLLQLAHYHYLTDSDWEGVIARRDIDAG